MLDGPTDSQGVIADALQSSDSAGGTDGPLLLGFVVVSEWMDLEGERWLAQESGTGRGDNIPKWQARGYLNEALNHWPEPETDEEDDDE